MSSSNQSNQSNIPLNIAPLEVLMRVDVAQYVDARGLSCPMPLLKAKLALNALSENDLLKVVATDAGSVRDFHAFAKLSGHSIHYYSEQGGEYFYIIQKSKVTNP